MTTGIHAVRAVLPDRIVENATIVVEDEMIIDIAEGAPHRPGSLDGRGAFCLPGLIDSHSDGLEKELSPRPGVTFPVDFALRSFEARVRSAGVTTIFHGVGYEEDERHGRTIRLAEEFVRALQCRAQADDALVDHRILYRLDARDPNGYLALAERLARHPDPTEPRPLVSFEDHTPGQGQYRDVEHFRKWMAGSGKYQPDKLDEALAEKIAERDAHLEVRGLSLTWLRLQASAARIRLLVHDPVDANDIAEAATWPATIAEFPTTVEAARAAFDRGLPAVMGAPNVLRGGSHSGNVAAEELVRLGLCSVLSSDYQPATLMAAVFLLAKRKAATLPGAVRLVTDGPAAMTGLTDRGRLEAGRRADLVLCRFDGHWPTVWHVQRAPLEQLVRV